MMDKKSIDEIAAAVEKIARSYPHIGVCVVMAQPCIEHNGQHIDLASCGESELNAFVDAAIRAYKPGEKTHPLNASLQ